MLTSRAKSTFSTGTGIHNYLHKMPRVTAALNAIQATPFRVNKTVLGILGEALQARGGDSYRLPPLDDLPLCR